METTTYRVTGPLAPSGRTYANVRAARRAVDRLDIQYGASAHTYQILTTTEGK